MSLERRGCGRISNIQLRRVKQLAYHAILPLPAGFARHGWLPAAWEAVPKELTATLLRTLVADAERPLQSAGSSTTGAGTAMNWRTSMFIASSKATKKAHELQEADSAIRQKKEEKDAEPPPLE